MQDDESSAAEAILDAVLGGAEPVEEEQGTEAYMWVALDEMDGLEQYTVQLNDHVVYELQWNQHDSHIGLDLVFR